MSSNGRLHMSVKGKDVELRKPIWKEQIGIARMAY